MQELAGPTPGDVGGSDPNALDLAIDRSGQYLYGVSTAAETVAVIALDHDRGALGPIDESPFDGGSFPYSIAIDPEARFVVVGNDDVGQFSIFALDPASGAIHPIPGSPFGENGLQPEMVIARFAP